MNISVIVSNCAPLVPDARNLRSIEELRDVATNQGQLLCCVNYTAQHSTRPCSVVLTAQHSTRPCSVVLPTQHNTSLAATSKIPPISRVIFILLYVCVEFYTALQSTVILKGQSLPIDQSRLNVTGPWGTSVSLQEASRCRIHMSIILRITVCYTEMPASSAAHAFVTPVVELRSNVTGFCWCIGHRYFYAVIAVVTTGHTMFTSCLLCTTCAIIGINVCNTR